MLTVTVTYRPTGAVVYHRVLLAQHAASVVRAFYREEMQYGDCTVTVSTGR